MVLYTCTGNWFYTPVLCLGIGIDDMFVIMQVMIMTMIVMIILMLIMMIMQSLSNVKRAPATASLTPDLQIAEALRHAGVAVTVTR